MQVLGVGVAIAIVARVVAQADPTATWRAVSRAGPWVPLALVPFAVGMTADSWGAKALLRALGHRVTLAQMLPLRLACEALHVTMPAGFVAADGAATVLLQSHCRVPVRDGVVSAVARRWLIMRAHAAYMAFGAVAGFSALATLSRDRLGSEVLPWALLGSAALPLAVSAGIRGTLLGSSTLAGIRAALARIPSPRLARWLASQQHQVDATSAQIARLRGARGPIVTATLSFLAAWCCEALESALLLMLAGAHIEVGAVFAVEAGLSVVRAAVVIAPSGLGVVDLGYATLFGALGADAAAASAFVLLKRGKEAAWAAVGFALLTRRASASQGHPSVRPVALPSQ